MRVALSTTGRSPVNFTHKKVLLTPCIARQFHHDFIVLSKTYRRFQSIGCSKKTPDAEHFGESNKSAIYLKNIAESLQVISPEPFKEFQWTKAKLLVAERLVTLGQKALKWLLVVVLAFGFPSDVLISVSRNWELMIPLGLFIGIMLADLLKESSLEFFQSKVKDESMHTLLLGVGSFFVLVKLFSLCFNGQGRLLLSHIGNGGLMQALWLAIQQQQTVKDEVQEQ